MMRFRHPQHEYTWQSSYFVTIVARNREALFGDIQIGIVQMNSLGTAVTHQWEEPFKHFPATQSDAFIVMPDHIHGIVHFVSYASYRLGIVIGQFKSYSSRYCNKLQDNAGVSLWQRNYYERIIRNETAQVFLFIMKNPWLCPPKLTE
jgi:putative transposase